MTAENNAYENLQKLHATIDQINEIYKEGNHRELRKLAAAFASEHGGEETEARIFLDPNYSIDRVQENVEIASAAKQESLEDLVENGFDDVLDAAPLEALNSSLISYKSKEDVTQGYREQAKYHEILRNIALFDNSKKNPKVLEAYRIDPRDVNHALSKMGADVLKHYQKIFEMKSGDNEHTKNSKKLLMTFFTNLYIGKEGEPIEGGRYIRIKYEEIHKEELESFEKVLRSQSGLVKHVRATLPEDKKSRLSFLRVLALAGAKKNQD